MDGSAGPARPAADELGPDEVCLASQHQLGHRAPGLLDRYVGGRPVDLIQVDVVAAGLPKRRVDRASHLLGAGLLPSSRGATLVNASTSSRPAMWCPTIRSDSPWPYTSAVSIQLMPASSPAWMASTTSRVVVVRAPVIASRLPRAEPHHQMSGPSTPAPGFHQRIPTRNRRGGHLHDHLLATRAWLPDGPATGRRARRRPARAAPRRGSGRPASGRALHCTNRSWPPCQTCTGTAICDGSTPTVVFGHRLVGAHLFILPQRLQQVAVQVRGQLAGQRFLIHRRQQR